MIILPPPLKNMVEQIAHGPVLSRQEIEGLDPAKGAYLLVIDIKTAFDLTIATLRATTMKAGFYVYCGSACGPGGIKARLKRHFAHDKRRHWHVDHMTLQASELAALVIEDGDECDLARELMLSGRFITPVTGFGASDCSTCNSHLLAWAYTNRP